MVSIRQWEHSRWRLLKFALIAVWAANNLIQGPLNTHCGCTFIYDNKLYLSRRPQSKVLPGAESHAVVRMFTMVDDAPKVVLSKENLFVCVSTESKLAASQPPRASVSADVRYGDNIWAAEGVCGRSDRRSGKNPCMANWQTNYFVRLFCLPWK